MSSYNPPSEDITEFNTSLFNQPEETLSQAEADKLYLSKTKSDISTAGSTTFNGGVNVGGTLSLTSGANTSELSQSGNTLTIANKVPNGSVVLTAQTAGGANQGIALSTTSLTMNNFCVLNTRIIRSTDTGSTTHSLFDNLTSNANLYMGGALGSNQIRGNTNFTQNATFNGGVNVGGTLSLTSGANTSEIFQSGKDFEIKNMNTAGLTTFTNQTAGGTNTTIMTLSATGTSPSVTIDGNTELKCKGIKSTTPGSTVHTLFDNMTGAGTLTIGGTATSNTIRGNTTFTQNVITNNLINLNASTYPLATAQTHLGYYLQSTGTAVTQIAAISTINQYYTLHNITLEKGVWRIDYNVKMECIVAGGISRENTFISATSSVTNTPLDNPNAQVFNRSTITNQAGDISFMGNSFTYIATASTTLYLTIARQAATGTYDFTGSIGATRIG